jgi:hypothetical protein
VTCCKLTALKCRSRQLTSFSRRKFQSIRILDYCLLRKERADYRLVLIVGKQVRFFMTFEDEQNFVAAMNQIAPTQLVWQTFKDKAKMEVRPLEPVGTALGDAYVCLVNSALANSIKIDFFPTQSNYVIDLAESEVVQFHRCEPRQGWLSVGRLWLDERSNSGKKSEAFVKWAASLLRWIRNHYEKGAVGNYVGPHASEQSKAGKLQLGPSDKPSLSLEERKRILGLE